MVPVDVRGLAVLPPMAAPVLLLRESVGERRWLAITIGEAEASALLTAHTGEPSARPGTIELLGHIIEALGSGLRAVEVTALTDGIFYAELVLDGELRVSARPSDAIALGLRAGVPLHAAEAVLDVAALESVVFDGADAEDTGDAAEEDKKVEHFRELLDRLTPDDFRD
ncbi:bifunctional nuclease family protein [Amycolatopsis sp. cg5]|uniref:bifunctional nuclease family protein n=1 Tax=Amycolatopsis sp. cg5 TaxID=3238802 RepID=UPI003524E670